MLMSDCFEKIVQQAQAGASGFNFVNFVVPS
jgi:hypothetical protein